jgi:predicted Zn-dependent protease
VVGQDERHSFSEVLRELGGIYVTARQSADARSELTIYTERRPYDPEGLFYYGQALEGPGDTAAARDAYARAGCRGIDAGILPAGAVWHRSNSVTWRATKARAIQWQTEGNLRPEKSEQNKKVMERAARICARKAARRNAG